MLAQAATQILRTILVDPPAVETRSPQTVAALAARHDGASPVPADPQRLAEYFSFTDFAHFIEVYLSVVDLIRDAEDVWTLTYDIARDMARQNIRYAELTLTPYSSVIRGIAAEAFCEADSHENAARAFVNAASVFSGAHDEKSAKTASRNAGYAFTRQFDEMDGGQTDRGIRVLRDAFNAFDYAGAYDSALWTGTTLHRHLCDGGQAEAAAEVARRIAAVMRRNGLPGQAVGWEAMGAEPSNAGQVARNE